MGMPMQNTKQYQDATTSVGVMQCFSKTLPLLGKRRCNSLALFPFLKRNSAVEPNPGHAPRYAKARVDRIEGGETNDTLDRQQRCRGLCKQLVHKLKNATRNYQARIPSRTQRRKPSEVGWCKLEEMPADLFTKNLGGPQFNKHTATFCGEGDYG
jgi:hypothetical protein